MKAFEFIFHFGLLFLLFSFSSFGSEVVTVDVHAAKKLLGSGHKYLDVRTEEEFKNGHVENALNIPYLFTTPEGKVKNPKFMEQVLAACSKEDRLVVVNNSLHICPDSDESNRFLARFVTREIHIPCCELTTDRSAAEAEKILSSKLQIPLPGRGEAVFMKKHYGECFSGCPDADEDEDWVEQFQDFLHCVRGKSYNLGHNIIIPVTLNIDSLRSKSDVEYFDTIFWLARQRQCNPHMERIWTALLTSFDCQGAKGDCPICLEDLSLEDLSVTAIPVCLSCSHCFHTHCIWKWLNGNPSCPVCRFKFQDPLNG